MNQYDWIIRGGRVIDPANGVDDELDLAISDGVIARVGRSLDVAAADRVYEAGGQLIVPGFIDLHAHCYDKGTPWGVDIDHYNLGRGVTTTVDAGSSGCDTFDGFRTLAVERFRSRVLAFLNISRVGMSVTHADDGSELTLLDRAEFINRQDCTDCIESNRDVLVGVKVLLTASMCDDGRNEAEALRESLAAAAAAATPLMAHHNFTTVSRDDCPGGLRAGDIYTHCYHGFDTTVIDVDSRRLHSSARAARERGVLFDIAHGMGAFNWTVGEICAAEGFWPDIISTDMHTMTCEGPAYDMPTVLSRMLHLGMPLGEVIRCSTIAPAEAIGWGDRIGTLGVGREADIAALAFVDADMELEDCQSQMRRISRRLTARAVWRGGTPADITEPSCFPNQQRIEELREVWPRLLIRDASLD
jgi:dihydroorotase